MRSEADKKAAEAKKQGEKVVNDAKSTVVDYRGRAERAMNSAKSELHDDGTKKK
jgi:hypothetical protein